MPGNRGGARAGSGPKPKPNAMITRTFVIRKDQAQMIKLEAALNDISQSEWLRRVLDTPAAIMADDF